MEVFRKLGVNLSCVAAVVHGTEIRMVLVRAILTGMAFLVPQFQPARVFKEIEAAAKWMRPRLGVNPSSISVWWLLRVPATADRLDHAVRVNPCPSE